MGINKQKSNSAKKFRIFCWFSPTEKICHASVPARRRWLENLSRTRGRDGRGEQVSPFWCHL